MESQDGSTPALDAISGAASAVTMDLVREPVVPFRWRWWPYALLLPILTFALSSHNVIPLLDAAAAGAFVLFACARAGLRPWIGWLGLALFIGVMGRSTGVEAVIRACGFAGTLVLGFMAARPDALPETRARSQEAAGICLAIPIIGMALIVLRGLHPLTYDGVLAHIDAWGPPVAWQLARAYIVENDFRLVCQIAYFGLPLALVLVGELERGRVPHGQSVFVAAFLAAVIGAVAYQVVPATGPIFSFPGYPGEQPPSGFRQLSAPFGIYAPRNAMPSLHVTWALLVAWHAARSGWFAGVLGAALLVLTMLAALAMGEHYLIDLVLAVPFAMAFAAAVAGQRRLATVSFLAVAGGLLAIVAYG